MKIRSHNRCGSFAVGCQKLALYFGDWHRGRCIGVCEGCGIADSFGSAGRLSVLAQAGWFEGASHLTGRRKYEVW